MSHKQPLPVPAARKPLGDTLIAEGLRLRRHAEVRPDGEDRAARSIAAMLVLSGILVQIAREDGR